MSSQTTATKKQGSSTTTHLILFRQEWTSRTSVPHKGKTGEKTSWGLNRQLRRKQCLSSSSMTKTED